MVTRKTGRLRNGCCRKSRHCRRRRCGSRKPRRMYKRRFSHSRKIFKGGDPLQDAVAGLYPEAYEKSKGNPELIVKYLTAQLIPNFPFLTEDEIIAAISNHMAYYTPTHENTIDLTRPDVVDLADEPAVMGIDDDIDVDTNDIDVDTNDVEFIRNTSKPRNNAMFDANNYGNDFDEVRMLELYGFDTRRWDNWIQAYFENPYYTIHDNEGAGDCFFAAIRDAYRRKGLTVKVLRKMVADAITQETFEDYKMINLMMIDDRKPGDPIAQSFMDNVNSLQEMKRAVLNNDYWGDELAIRIIQKALKIQLIILYKGAFKHGRYNNIIQCNTSNPSGDAFYPRHYIILDYSGSHYQVVAYQHQRIFNFNELPNDLLVEIATNCVSKDDSFSKIPDFVHFKNQLGL